MTATDQNENSPPEDNASDANAGASSQPAAPPDPQAEIARLQAEKREINDRMLRIAADFENYKRRARREMDEAGTRGMENLLKELLPVLDNLDRAIEAGAAAEKAGGAAASLLDGVRLVQKQFLSALEKSQIKSFDALGKPFDPQVHEAVQQIDSDTLQPGTVATVFQRGYTAGPRLLRPAMVGVVRSRPQPQSGAEAPGDGEDVNAAGLN